MAIFHYTSVKELDFNDLLEGDKVEFTLDKNEDRQFIATNVQLIEAEVEAGLPAPEPEDEEELEEDTE